MKSVSLFVPIRPGLKGHRKISLLVGGKDCFLVKVAK